MTEGISLGVVFCGAASLPLNSKVALESGSNILDGSEQVGHVQPLSSALEVQADKTGVVGDEKS